MRMSDAGRLARQAGVSLNAAKRFLDTGGVRPSGKVHGVSDLTWLRIQFAREQLQLCDAQPRFAIELDIAHDGGREALQAALLEQCQLYSVTNELVTEHGPGGGWPVYRITGTEAALRLFLYDYCGHQHERPQLAREGQQVGPMKLGIAWQDAQYFWSLATPVA
jgi:hypothetical protein